MAKTTDGRVSKTPKKNKDKRVSGLDLEKGLKSEDDNESLLKSPSSESKEDKRLGLGGVIIDGRTYTCATCKAGHRVGVCKHANERPMKATHPPGRPAAGAPKKIICDCPRECSCLKKDCKCPRNCKCTQIMYMLVYIPEPGKEDNPQDDSGMWKVDKEVVTDLKGNILSPQQVEERKQQKEAIKAEHSAMRSRSASTTVMPQPISPSKAKPIAEGGCCSHKQKIVEQQRQQQEHPVAPPISAQLQHSNGVQNDPIEGCNCGAVCKCEFCPQHPNNSTSRHLAMQQVKHFQNQQMAHSSNNISFLPDMPHNASCMGGQPRFAMSTNPYRPSFAQLQQTFPNPGYVIAYPVWSMRNQLSTDVPSPNHAHIAPAFGDMSSSGLNLMPEAISSTTNDGFSSNFEISEDSFNIGNAFVASAGPAGWQGDMFSPDGWPMTTPSEISAHHYDLSNVSPPNATQHLLKPTEDDAELSTIQHSVIAATSQMPAGFDCQYDSIQYSILPNETTDYQLQFTYPVQPSVDLSEDFSPVSAQPQYRNRV